MIDNGAYRLRIPRLLASLDSRDQLWALADRTGSLLQPATAPDALRGKQRLAEGLRQRSISFRIVVVTWEGSLEGVLDGLLSRHADQRSSFVPDRPWAA